MEEQSAHGKRNGEDIDYLRHGVPWGMQGEILEVVRSSRTQAYRNDPVERDLSVYNQVGLRGQAPTRLRGVFEDNQMV